MAGCSQTVNNLLSFKPALSRIGLFRRASEQIVVLDAAAAPVVPRLAHPWGALPDGAEGLLALGVADLPRGFQVGFLPVLRLPKLAALAEVLIPQLVEIPPPGQVLLSPAGQCDDDVSKTASPHWKPEHEEKARHIHVVFSLDAAGHHDPLRLS
jgi:hypothetical protein